MEYNIDWGVFDFELIAGNSEVIQFTQWEKIDLTGRVTPWNLNGKEVRVHFKLNPEDKHIDLALTSSNGGIVVNGNCVDLIFDENTLNLCPNSSYYYDVLVIDEGQRYNTVRGVMRLKQPITT